jgi:hypothetical protein
MKSSRVALLFGSLSVLTALLGCSHQTPPVTPSAQVARPSIAFAVYGPRAEPSPSSAEAEPADPQDKPIVDAMHGFNHASPR